MNSPEEPQPQDQISNQNNDEPLPKPIKKKSYHKFESILIKKKYYYSKEQIKKYTERHKAKMTDI